MQKRFENIHELVDSFATDRACDPAFLYAEGGRVSQLSRREYRERILARSSEIERAEGSPSAPVALRESKTVGFAVEAIARLHAGSDIVLIPEDRPLPAGKLSPHAIPHVHSGDAEAEGRAVFFTSGTTSASKGVVLSSKALLSACFAGQSLAGLGPGDVLLSLLPFSHVFGFVCSLLWGLAYGSAVALSRGVHEMFKDADFFHATVLSAVPRMLEVMARANALGSDMRLIVVGAAPCPPTLLESIESRGIEVHAGYGLTETASGIALHTKSPDPVAYTPCPGCDIRIEPDGEISVSCGSLMEGYCEAGEIVAGDIRAGRLHTGDLGYLDGNGDLHVTGRKKEVLVLGNGTKVFLPEEEEELAQACGTPDLAMVLRGGRLSIVLGTPLPGQLTEAGIKALVEEINGGRRRDEQITDVMFHHGPLPRTETGKIKRYLLGNEAR